MSFFAQAPTKRLLAVHGWSGTLLGLLLYVVVITGTVSVFVDELAQWSVGDVYQDAPLAQPLDSRLKGLAADVDPAYLDELAVFRLEDGTIWAFFHAHENSENGQIAEKGVRFLLDPRDLSIKQRDEGFAEDLPSYSPSAFAHFIAELHVNLHAPRPWGLFATGILGFAMLIALVSGVLIHKHVIKELLVTPRRNNPVLNRRDRHVLAGSWSLPFGFILAFTGTFFSFAGSVTLPVVAFVAFGGDQEALFENVVGGQLPEDKTPADVANLDAILSDSMARAGSPPEFFFIQHWGRADATVQVQHGPEDDALSGVSHRYMGSSGEFLGVKPLVGTEPSLGNTLVSLVGPLHFGNFAGLLSKIVWFSLGVAMCYVTLTGMQLWTARRADDPNWAWMESAIVTVGYGTGLGMAGAGLAFFPGLAADQAEWWTGAGFLGACAVAIGLGLAVRDRQTRSSVFRLVLGASLIALPLVRILSGGPGWPALLASGAVIVVALDWLLVISGAAFVVLARRPTALEQRLAEVPREAIAG